jgi:hypothetical protein
MDFYWKRGVLGSAIIIVLVITLFLTFRSGECENVECFQDKMIKCSFVKYVNEEPEASWGYEIIGKRGNQCEIEVTLLSAKEGSLGLRSYEGNSMSCFYEVGTFAYPEKSLDACTGRLKENLQSIIIEKLYKYVVDNLGEIEEELRGV